MGAALGIALLAAAFDTHVVLSSVLSVLFHGMVGTSYPMFYSITSQAAGSGDQGKMLGMLSFFKDLSSAVSPKLGEYLWSCGSEARKNGATWAAILPASVGTLFALAAATLLLVAWRRSATRSVCELV